MQVTDVKTFLFDPGSAKHWLFVDRDRQRPLWMG